MIINLITRPRDKVIGLSRYDKSLYSRISEKAVVNIFNVKPLPIPGAIIKLFNLVGLDPATATTNYPFYLRPKPKEGIWHFTSQSLATILNFIEPEKSVVTAHDIIPFITRHDEKVNPSSKLERLLDNISIRGLKRADRIITDSRYSKETIVQYLGYPEERIDVVYLAVDHDKFKVVNNGGKILENFGIKNEPIVLYVGSETPRKNLQTLIEAFHKLKKKIPNAKLIKVGEHQSQEGRERLKSLIKKLNLEKDIIFTGYVTEEELPIYYNIADLFVIPSLYEGFGLPVLEAMACGTPVISSNASSLPELVGGAGIMLDPKDVNGFTSSMYEVLTNEIKREEMKKEGLKRAKDFTWEKTAEETVRVYEKLDSSL